MTADQSLNLSDGKSRGRYVAQFSYGNAFKKILQHLLVHYCAIFVIILLVIKNLTLEWM